MREWREWRTRCGLTQASLATAIGVTRPAISRLEHGLQGLAACRLGRLVDALGLTDEERTRALDLLRLRQHRFSTRGTADRRHGSPSEDDGARGAA